MGCTTSLNGEDLETSKDTKKIEAALKSDFEEEKKIIKLLLLGTGGSGKSTVFKQMQLLYEQTSRSGKTGFSDQEKTTFRHVVRRNAVESMQTLAYAMTEDCKIAPSNPSCAAAIDAILNADPLNADFWDASFVGQINLLWTQEPGIQKVYKDRGQLGLQIEDTAKYLFENIQRIGESSYIPTNDDILRARLRTSGIVERDFKIQGSEFRFLDVGGQRNERRKWIHCFEGVTAVIFVAAISEFDQVLYEDDDVNRLHESLVVFESITQSRHFVNTPVILFLNKVDVFNEKISLEDKTIRTCFPEYDGPLSVDDQMNYIKEKFREKQFPDAKVAEDSEDRFFPHFTTALDTQNIQRVFDSCRKVILTNNLERLGLK